MGAMENPGERKKMEHTGYTRISINDFGRNDTKTGLVGMTHADLAGMTHADLAGITHQVKQE